MADLSYSVSNKIQRTTNWGAVWAGVFTFIAIWSTFEMLGIAIFSSSASTGTGSGIDVGTAIWTIILSLIAMYIAGRATGHFAPVTDRYEGLIHGMMMFGLSVVAVLVLAELGRTVTNNNLNARGLTLSSALDWMIFGSLVLGWLGAMTGAAANTGRKVKSADNVRDIRTAA